MRLLHHHIYTHAHAPIRPSTYGLKLLGSGLVSSASTISTARDVTRTLKMKEMLYNASLSSGKQGKEAVEMARGKKKRRQQGNDDGADELLIAVHLLLAFCL